MAHMSFTDVVNSIANSTWGREFETPDDAAKEMVGDLPRLTAYALVELLKRLNAVASAVGREPTQEDRALRIPVNAKRFPHKNVGDRVFAGDLIDGFWECIVVAKNDEGVCLIVRADDFDLQNPPRVFVACDWMWSTMEEALQNAAEEDREYHEPRLKYAKAALVAVKNGVDLTSYRDGMADDD